jgi:LmbE family N-acetylglucosaminyl deacetylase
MMRSLAPPGRTVEVRARRVLVLAPHPDDEVIGCGGLLAQLVRSGADARVLILTDGAGGVEGVPDSEREPERESGADQDGVNERERYRARRRDEAARASELLGPYTLRFLELPDGSLRHHLATLAEAIAEELRSRVPDLILVPSPLEATPDHQAAFAALHDVLASVRASDTDVSQLASVRVLTFEVNHPQYPDLLVDVGAELELIERALACYGSQLARHDYHAATLGLRRYRVHSLPPEVRAAEGYASLALADFTTRSHAQLIEELGGNARQALVEAGPLVSVIVRTFERPEFLGEALASLARSTYPRLEVVVVNDGGAPIALPEGLPFAHRLVELPKNRGRAAAGNAGLEAASGAWIGFLDDDDLVAPEHVATLVDAASATGVHVVYSDAAVGIYELSGGDSSDGRGPRGWACVERRLPYSRDFDPDLLVVDNYIPSNTLLIAREPLLATGGFDTSLPFFEDWDLWIRLAQRTPFHHLRRVTCEYRHFRGAGHHVLGGGASRDRDPEFLATKARVLRKHKRLLTPERLARVVVTMRREEVERGERLEVARLERASIAQDRSRLGEDLEHARAQRQQTQERYFELEKHFHRLNGEVGELREQLERERIAAAEGRVEVDRLYRRERELVADQERRIADQEQRIADQERLNVALGVALEESRRSSDERRALSSERDRWRQSFSEESSERQRVQERYFELEKHFHRLYGEIVGLREELERQHRAATESALALQRLFDRESELDSVAAQTRDQLAQRDEALRATYAEIGRLNALIAQMEQSRAWRLHRLAERLKGRGA